MARNKNKDPIKVAVDKISDDINHLSTRKECAISVFRSTANQLASINSEMEEKMSELDTLADFIQHQKDIASKVVSDNENVRAKILEIIGE